MSNQLVELSSVYNVTSPAGQAGVCTITTPANSFFLGTSRVLGLKVNSGQLTLPLFIKSITYANNNSSVATIVVNSSSGGAAETGTCTLIWVNESGNTIENA